VGNGPAALPTITDLLTAALDGHCPQAGTLEPGDPYEVPLAQAQVWAEHGVAEIVNTNRRGKPSETGKV